MGHFGIMMINSMLNTEDRELEMIFQLRVFLQDVHF